MPDSTKMSLKYILQSFMTKGFVSEIFYAYTGLKRSYNTQLSNGINESRLLAYSFFISLVLFLHRLPDKLIHNQKFNTKISLNDQIGIDLFASLFFSYSLVLRQVFRTACWGGQARCNLTSAVDLGSKNQCRSRRKRNVEL